MSNSSIVTVRELIDMIFGESDVNVVNFKLMQTVLYLLARQLRLLERRIGIEFGTSVVPTTSSLSITEVKLQAKVPKKRKKIIKSGGGLTEANKIGATTAKAVDDNTPKKTFQEISSTDKSSELTSSKSTTEKSTTDKTSSKSTTDKTTPSSSDKTKTDKSSSDKTKSSAGKSSSTKESSDKSTRKETKKKDYRHVMEIIEQQREHELRVVNQRADSHEVAEKTPTPMASLDSLEVQYEKLLVVERVPASEAEKKIGRLRDVKAPKLSVVTQDEFDELAQIVKELQKKFGLVGKADFPENMQLMQDLRRGASLTDAMAALQISARIEAAEKTLKHMTSLITDLATSKRIEIADEQEIKIATTGSTETKVIYDAPTSGSKSSRKPGLQKKGIQTKLDNTEEMQIFLSSEAPLIDTEEPLIGIEDLPKLSPDCINMTELNEAMQEMFDNLTKTVGNLTNKAISNAEDALKIARRLEGKLDATVGLDIRMNDLELLVSEYAGQINTLDASLSSQMTTYQEQLTQMQHDLEGGLEAMAEALANPPGDTAGSAELNANFTNLQVEFDITNIKQKDLKENQELLSVDVQALWKEIEILRGIKSDRDEVADALRDKAGLGALNGLVTQQQFDAVRGDFEKRIGASYDKFNNQEIVWQKIIDDLLRELNEKADWVQLASLRDDVNNNLVKLQNKIHTMMEIIGEPRSASVSKKLFRDTACLSCSTPAHMNLEEATLPALPAFSKSSRPPTIGAEDTTKPKEDGDHGLCYPGQQIPHPRDPRSHICQRYCGGSHTTVRGTLSRTPRGIIISALGRETTGVGSDGKVYMMEQPEYEIKPCVPCNIPNTLKSQPVENGKGPQSYEFGSEQMPFYVLPAMTSMAEPAVDSVSVTPPLHDEY